MTQKIMILTTEEILCIAQAVHESKIKHFGRFSEVSLNVLKKIKEALEVRAEEKSGT